MMKVTYKQSIQVRPARVLDAVAVCCEYARTVKDVEE